MYSEHKYQELSDTMSYGGESDIDGKELALEIRSLSDLPSVNMTALDLLKYIHEKEIKELYPNIWIALRIAVTLPVIVTTTERSFSKLKLIKTYLRSMMAQGRITGLAVISINHAVGHQVSYDDIIDDFAAKRATKQKFYILDFRHTNDISLTVFETSNRFYFIDKCSHVS